ncbi:adenylate/guanylate cyclase with Chase sensor [[Leptolyngbya] sp. PCC 7376]|uniref:CHASE2 domain-containing protein n=1 Tax=[Leptolyngbya] sp. PCC 7376 TaxID=111781 RepID=UPI00029F1B1E|nr:adenylate/guanylate cyclase domain-containing protein [[Leptolyngbya] sp. PCC 7376]AFY38227.1 adenylate/guanylate cyclase with Chase sensor [[Leptolyngbya] sp. PCC 7376]
MWHRIKEFGWNWRGVLVTTPAIATLVWVLRLSGALQFVELAAYDQFVRWQPSEPLDDRILIVGIEAGYTSQPDAVYAELLSKLQDLEPRLIGLDIYRDIPIDPGHDDLVAVFKKYDNIFGIEKIVGENDTQTVPPPETLAEKDQVGFNDLVTDDDARIRRSLLTVEDETGKDHYALNLLMAGLYLQEEGISIGADEETGWYKLGDVVLEPLDSNSGSYTGVDNGGYQIFINYRGAAGSFAQVTMSEILSGQVPPELVRDRIVLIGDVTEVSKDLFPVPYTLTAKQRMPGVEIHAHMASQLISAVLDDRPLMRSWVEWQEALWIIFWTGIGASLAWGLRNTGQGKAWSWERLIGIGFVAMVLVGSTYGALLSGLWLPIVSPGLGLFLSAVAITGFIARSAGQIRNTFGRYLSDEIVATLLESPEGLKLGGERRTITILTSDLRGFTGISERLDPEEVVKLLNLYLSDMADVITDYMGTIDEFMGDGILVLFGAPLPRADDPERAIACAVAMQLALSAVNEKIQAFGLAPFEMGIGVHTGDVVVGNIGSEKRAKYGVVGSQVNLTYRIESYTTGGQILISERTYNLLEDILEIRGTQQVSPKGVKEPITIYQVGGIKGKYNLRLPEIVEEFCPVPEAIAVKFSVLQGKDIVSELNYAEIWQLSEREAYLRLHTTNGAMPPKALANLKLNFAAPAHNDLSDDFYAKVIANPNLAAPDFQIKFTMRPPQIHTEFSQLYSQAQEAENLASSSQ